MIGDVHVFFYASTIFEFSYPSYLSCYLYFEIVIVRYLVNGDFPIIICESMYYYIRVLMFFVVPVYILWYVSIFVVFIYVMNYGISYYENHVLLPFFVDIWWVSFYPCMTAN